MTTAENLALLGKQLTTGKHIPGIARITADNR